MPRRNLCLFPLLLFLAYPIAASAEGDSGSPAAESVSAKGFDQMLYKGLVGNALDVIPMDPSQRLSLQRTNAIVSNTLSGRSLALLAGLSNPVLLIGGLVWGIWSASNIKPVADQANAVSYPAQLAADSAAPKDRVALLADAAPAAQATLAKPAPETAAANPVAAGEADETSRVRVPVVRVWLPQRSSTVALVR
jgi:hypothetical protein